MMKRSYMFVVVFVLLFAGAADAQYPILDMIAQKVIQKYQQSTCEQLWQQKNEPKPPMEQEIIQKLRSDPADEHRVHQQSRGSRRQQDVSMRDDSMMVAKRPKTVFTTETQSSQSKISKFELF